mgnify:CR=1 FL=1
MRAYFFGNMYLSSIQQGIQAQHCTVAMYKKYFPRPTLVGECCFEADEQAIMLSDWAFDHETDVLLNGGYAETMHELYRDLDVYDNPYPFAKFHEGHDSLGGVLTCVGIILPADIYEVAAEVRKSFGKEGRDNVDKFNHYGEWSADYDGMVHTYDKWQVWLINELNKYGLAK